MLNGFPLNSAPLNSLGAGAAEPEYIVRGFAFVWRIRLMVNGVDMSAQLTGAGDVDREEGAAGVAGFGLYIPSGAIDPDVWVGLPVTIDYISTSAGVTTEERRFTGTIAARPVWDPRSRVLSCECSDQLQRQVESMTVLAIDALVGGWWAADIYEPVTGRSHWDYAQERLASMTASLDASPSGELRVTSWFAASAGGYVFGPGTTLDDSVDVELPAADAITNQVEIESTYRYSRMMQYTLQYHWTHPGTMGVGGMGGFCLWRTDTTELPSIEMVIDATEQNSLTAIESTWYRLPPTNPDPCGTEQPWVNTATDLLLGTSWLGARRWVQTVTETYTLTLSTSPGLVEATRIISRTGQSFEVESGEADGWADSLNSIRITATGSGQVATPKPGFGDPGDRDSEPRRLAALNCQLRTAYAEIIAAHRENTVSWSVPASMAMGIDLIHTLELDDQGVHARGKCRRIVTSWDLDSGEAVTTLSIAVMRRVGAEVTPSTLTPPTRLGIGAGSGPEIVGPVVTLPTQLGGKLTSPAYDDELDGFAGNYSAVQDLTLETFPRRLTCSVPEIPAEDTDELALAGVTSYLVNVPNDILEM